MKGESDGKRCRVELEGVAIRCACARPGARGGDGKDKEWRAGSDPSCWCGRARPEGEVEYGYIVIMRKCADRGS